MIEINKQGHKTYGEEDVELIKQIEEKIKQQQQEKQQYSIFKVAKGYVKVSCRCGYWTQEKPEDMSMFASKKWGWICLQCHREHEY